MRQLSASCTRSRAYLFRLLLGQHFHLIISNLNVHLFALFAGNTNQLHLMQTIITWGKSGDSVFSYFSFSLTLSKGDGCTVTQGHFSNGFPLWLITGTFNTITRVKF